MLSENEIAEMSLEVLITILSEGLATLVAFTTKSTDTLSALSRDHVICRDPSPLAVTVRFSGANGGPKKLCGYLLTKPLMLLLTVESNLNYSTWTIENTNGYALHSSPTVPNGSNDPQWRLTVHS